MLSKVGGRSESSHNCTRNKKPFQRHFLYKSENISHAQSFTPCTHLGSKSARTVMQLQFSHNKTRKMLHYQVFHSSTRTNQALQSALTGHISKNKERPAVQHDLCKVFTQILRKHSTINLCRTALAPMKLHVSHTQWQRNKHND